MSKSVEFVVIGVDEDDHNTGCPTMAYPVDCDEAITNVKDLFEGAEVDLFIMSNYGIRPHDTEQWEGHEVRVDYKGSCLTGFLICDEPVASFGDQIRRQIKFTQMGRFTDNKEQLTRLLLGHPYFELI